MKLLLDEWQWDAVEHLGKEKRGIEWAKVGEGKSRIAIVWSFIVVGNENPIPLIICSPQAFRQWRDEISQMGLKDTYKPKFFSAGMLSHENGIRALNRLLSSGKGINCIVIDELWMYKNVKAKRTKTVHRLSKQLPCIGLSGSMMTARNIEDLYGQAFAMDLSEKVARTFTDFRREFCIEVQNRAGFIERYPKKNAVVTIQEKLRNNVHIYFPKEVREIRDITVNVDPTKEQLVAKRQLIKEYYFEATTGGAFTVEIKSASALLSKLQQISDGFIYNMDGASLSIPSNKMQRLLQHCSELCDGGEKVLVWCAFRQTIEEAYKLSPFEAVLLSGDHEFDSRKWKENKPMVCYATIGSGSSLNDFASVRYSIVYSATYSHRQMQQAKGRTNRKSTLHNCCYYYYFQTIGFPDAKVYEALELSKSTEEFVIETTRKIVTQWLMEQNQQLSK